MSLHEYNQKYQELKYAVKKFEESLPSQFYIDEDGLIKENQKVLMSEIKITKKTYMMNENKDTKLERVKHTVKCYDHEIKEVMHDLQYVILGLCVTELGDGDIPTEIAGLDFEKLELEKLKLDRLKNYLTNEEEPSFVDVLYAILYDILSHGWEYDYSILFENEDILLDSLKNHVENEEAIYYNNEELERLFHEINSGKGFITFVLECLHEYDYNDSIDVSLTVKTGTDKEFAHLKENDYKNMKLI